MREEAVPTKANFVAFVGTDETRAAVLRQVLEPESGVDVPPPGLVRPSSGVVHWFLTEKAAEPLKSASV